MKPLLFYKIMAGFYDLLDVIYFQNDQNSPRRAVLESIDLQDKILDLCTGTATISIKIAQRNSKAKIIGIDISEDMLRIAKEKVQKNHIQNVKLYSMNATKMKFKDNCFDKVLISLVLHELEETLVDSILREAARVLKEDGQIIVTEWEPSRSIWRKILFLPIQLLEPKPYRAFIKKDLHAYFGKFGLKIVEEVHCDYSKVLKVKKI